MIETKVGLDPRSPAGSSIAPRLPDRVRPSEGAPVSLELVGRLLRGLDARQRAAVTHGEGPLRVIAGPGTGKTRVVTRRIAWLIATKRARPAQILALTFTGRAADEMQGRVDQLMPYGYADTAIQTFHAFGDGLVREHALRLGLPPEPRLVTRPEAVALIRESLFGLDLKRYRPLGDPARFLGALVELFGRAKQEDVTPDEWSQFAMRVANDARTAEPADRAAHEAVAAEQLELAGAFAAYQALLGQAGAIDFGDQVGLALRLLRDHPDVRAEVQRRYRYVLVDEFQDTDPAQAELLALVAGDAVNVTVVGDDDQAIYGFRGAVADGLGGFAARFAATRTIALGRNHRSRQPILDAARRLAAHGAQADRPAPPILRAVRRATPRPVVGRGFATTADEAGWIATEIASRLRGGARPQDHAVLVRANADAGPIVRALSGEGVPWWFSGGTGLYGRPVARELLAFLRVTADLERSTDLWALATAEPYRLGGPALTLLLGEARRRRLPLWTVLEETDAGGGPVRLVGPARQAVQRLLADLRAASALAHERPTTDVLFDHLRRSGRLARLAAGGPGADAQLADLSAFYEAVRSLGALLPDPRLPMLVPHLASLIEAGDEPQADVEELPGDVVSVLTVHKAKGLEFPVVFVAGLAEGRFPARSRPAAIPFPEPLRWVIRREAGQSRDAESMLLEERRLAYVALTRARDELVLTWAARGEGRRLRRPSPFLAEALDGPPPAAPVPETAPEALTAALAAVVEPGSPRPARGEARLASRLDLSFSQLDTYLACPLQYRYRYVLGVPAPAHHLLTYGSALHAAVAAYHAAEMRGQPLDGAALESALREAWRPDGYLSREHEEARFAAGAAALERFRLDRLESRAAPPVAVEQPFSVQLEGDRIRGRFDRVDREADGEVVTDYKSTTLDDPSQARRRARESLQLAVYALAHEAATGRLPVAVQLHFLGSGSVGRVAVEASRLERARATIRATGGGIRAGAFEAQPGVMTCGSCPYRQICPQSLVP